jgi:hypothetical protein
VVHQWEIATGKRVRTLDAKALWSYNAGQAVDFGGVRSLAMSPDGKQHACAGLHKAENPLGAVHEPLVRADWESRAAPAGQLRPGGQKSVAWRAFFPPKDSSSAERVGRGGHLLFWNRRQDKPVPRVRFATPSANSTPSRRV